MKHQAVPLNTVSIIIKRVQRTSSDERTRLIFKVRLVEYFRNTHRTSNDCGVRFICWWGILIIMIRWFIHRIRYARSDYMRCWLRFPGSVCVYSETRLRSLVWFKTTMC